MRAAAKVIGLTGGAGSGKSTAAGVFRRRGAAVIDADQLGHRLLEKGSPAYGRVVSAFGPGILSGNGDIDRRKLGELVFSDGQKMARLDRLVHPALLKAIRERVRRCRAEDPSRPVVIDAALIVQWGLEKRLDALIMIDSYKKLRLARLRARGLTESRARQIMAAQLPAPRIREKADLVVPNNGTVRELRDRAAAAWDEFVRRKSSGRAKNS